MQELIPPHKRTVELTFKIFIFLSPGYKGWTEIKKYGKICIRNDVVKTKHTLELLVLENPLVVRIYALLFDVN